MLVLMLVFVSIVNAYSLYDKDQQNAIMSLELPVRSNTAETDVIKRSDENYTKADLILLSSTDMPEPMLTFASGVAYQGLTSFSDNYQAANYIRNTMQTTYGGKWTAIVGSDFGHAGWKYAGTELNAYKGGRYVEIWKPAEAK